MNKRYEVQEETLADGWINNWSSGGLPTIFDDVKSAEAELNYFIQDCKEAYLDGYMEDYPDKESFRIVEVWED